MINDIKVNYPFLGNHEWHVEIMSAKLQKYEVYGFKKFNDALIVYREAQKLSNKGVWIK